MFSFKDGTVFLDDSIPFVEFANIQPDSFDFVVSFSIAVIMFFVPSSARAFLCFCLTR